MAAKATARRSQATAALHKGVNHEGQSIRQEDLQQMQNHQA